MARFHLHPATRAACLVAAIAAILCVAASPGQALVSDFSQGSNKNPEQGVVVWIRGILQQSNSAYYEGTSTLQRVLFTGISPTQGNGHVLRLRHQANKSTSHAYDFITSWDQALQAGTMIAGPTMFTAVDACGDKIGPPSTLKAVCAALHSAGNTYDVNVPDAMGNLLGDAVAPRVAAYEALLGNRSVRIYGSSPISSASMTFEGYVGSGDLYAEYTLAWTSTSDQICIELAGHLASGIDPFNAGIGYGSGKGSANISGGPYHFKLESLDGASLGSQDNQIKGADILLPPPVCSIAPSTQWSCMGGTAGFIDNTSGGGGGYTYCWQKAPYAGPCLSTSSSLDIAGATAADSGWYRVIVTDANALKDTCYAYFGILEHPQCNLSPGVDSVCIGSAATFSDNTSGGGGGYTYCWQKAPYTGPCLSSTSTLEIASATLADSGWYRVVVADANTCTDTSYAYLGLYESPVCSVTPADTSVCIGSAVSFLSNATGGTGFYSYCWQKGPDYTGACLSTSSTLALTNVQITDTGIYRVIVTEPCGCSDTCYAALTVYGSPTCSIARTGGERDTICPCFSELDPSLDQQFCGPEGMASYLWSIVGGGSIVGDNAAQCVVVRPSAHCDTTLTLSLTITDGHGCSSTCDRTLFVVDKTPPVFVYCPPDTVLECSDNLDDVFGSLPQAPKLGSRATAMTPAWQAVATDDCDAAPGTDYADTGGRPTNWMRRVDSVGSCGEDTTIVRTWTASDDCGNQAICVQVIAIQDTIPPALTCSPNVTVPCGTEVAFTPPVGLTDNCDPQSILEISEVSTDTVPGPDPGEFTHTRCWVATDSCGNASAICCQSVTVEACPEEFCTFSVGGWGTECPSEEQGDSTSNQPGCILEYYFNRVFPSGSVGIGDPAGVGGGLPNFYAAVWTSSDAVQAFLPASGTSGLLTSDALNPLSTSAGVLAGQILALRLNVEFSCAGVFRDAGLSESISCYTGFVIPASCGKFAGLTVEQFLALADEVVGGKKHELNPYGASVSDLNFTASCLNNLFDNCSTPVLTGGAGSAPGESGPEASADARQDNATVPVPKRFFVRQSYPNPFNPSATIVFALPRDGRVTVEICDVTGRSIVTLVDGTRQAGYHSTVWFGRDESGTPVASGVYFCRVQFGEEEDFQKLILLR